MRLSGVNGDLHAGVTYRWRFYGTCYSNGQQATRAIVDNMNKNKTRTWATSDLYELYISASGTLSKKQMICNITNLFGTEVIIMHIEGWESVLGMRSSGGSMVKLVKTMGGDEDAELDPPPLPAVALSPEETVQADTAMARARTRDAAWLSHGHTEDRPVEWAGVNAYLDRQETGTSTKKPDTGGIWSTSRCTCPP